MSYYIIKSLFNDQVLDVTKGGGKGTAVITYKKHGKANQLWYDHEATGTIRSKCNDLCLDIERDNYLVVSTYEPGDRNQQWRRQDNVIRNRFNNDLVLQILDVKTLKSGANGKCGQGPYHAEKHEQWVFEIVPTAGPAPQSVFVKAEEFYIESEKNGKVLAIADVPVKGKNTIVSMPIMQSKKYPPPRNQLWYRTQDGSVIHSSVNDHVFGPHSSGSLMMTPYKVDKKLQWKVDGKKILNGDGLCLDIRGDADKENAELCSYKYHGQPNQHWLIVRI